MYHYGLYMSFAGELSDDSDLYSLAQTATYFPIETENELTLSEELIDEMPVARRDWDEITIKNKPYQYKTSAINSNKLYNVIMDYSPMTTFFLKMVYGDDTFYGYFGQVDCKINEDRTIIRILPAVVDQYTDFIENYDTEVDVFGTKNLIKNGEFKVWTSGEPDSWEISLFGGVEHDTINDKDCVSLGKGMFGSFVLQSISVVANRQSYIEFDHAFVGESEVRRDLKYNVTLTGTTKTYQLQSDGSWVESGIVNKIAYKTNAYPIPEESVTAFETYNLVTQKLPESGYLAIVFYNDDATGDFVVITGVELSSSEIPYVDIGMILSNENLIIKTQEQVINFSTFKYYPTFCLSKKNSDIRPVGDYFESNGSPNMSLLADPNNAPNDGSLNYPDWVEIFENDENSTFYNSELCELGIAIGHDYQHGLFTRWANIHGYAKFARDEVYKTDAYDEFENLVPPEEDLGWVSTEIIDVATGKRLWVRKPFNGAYGGDNGSWTLSNLYTNGSVMMGAANIEYAQYKFTKVNYPTSDNSKSLATGMEFRDVCRKIYRSTHNSRLNKEVYSAFFWNDSPYMDFLDLETGLNYYTMKQNFLNKIACVHTSSIKEISDPTLSDSELKMSFKKLFEELQIQYPDLCWFIDEDENLHFEHKRLLGRISEYVDITDGVLPYEIGDYKSYDFDTSKLFGTIQRSQVNSYYKDFKKSVETFPKISSNKRRKDSKHELTTSFISTDIKGALENPTDIGNGMILVAYTVNESGVNEMIYGTGQITGNSVPNGVLSTSYLIKTFGNYEGTWNTGKVDGETKDYYFTQRCKMGADIKLKGIVRPSYLFTEMGVALIKSKKYDYGKEVTTCTPVYRHSDWYLVAESKDHIAFDYDVNI